MNYFRDLENPTWYNIWKRKGVERPQVSEFGIKGEEFRPNLLKILIDLIGMPDAGFVGVSVPLWLWIKLLMYVDKHPCCAGENLIKEEELHNLESPHLPFEREFLYLPQSSLFLENSLTPKRFLQLLRISYLNQALKTEYSVLLLTMAALAFAFRYWQAARISPWAATGISRGLDLALFSVLTSSFCIFPWRALPH